LTVRPAASRSRRIGALLLLAACCAVAPPAIAAADVAVLETSGGRHRIEVEVADTPKTREVGLMNRSSMPADHGMLFDFGENRPVSMWMKNTLIPLDMLFLDESGKVTRVKREATPESLDIIPSGDPVRYVLELNGGAAERYGVRNGDRLTHPIIDGAAR
jgi:uncharacterized protein